MNNKAGKISPFTITWNAVSTIGGVLGLVSFADDFILWKNIMNDLLTLYRSIVHFPILFLGIELNAMIIDYIFFGSICGGSFYKAMSYGMKNGYLTSGDQDVVVKTFYFLLYLLFWPLGILITLKQMLLGTEDSNEKHIKLRFLQWLGTILLLFVIILIINVTL